MGESVTITVTLSIHFCASVAVILRGFKGPPGGGLTPQVDLETSSSQLPSHFACEVRRARMFREKVRMRITEIYQSIQGESSYAGLPCVFVRTTGCDLRCSWCDSEFTFTGGTRMSIDQILSEVEKYPCELVELTGGEPLLQPEIYELATRLADAGHTVLIETGGHRDISKLDPRVIRIMDLKCPASGESEKNLWSNIEHLRPVDEVKFVIADREDYEWTLKTIREHGLEDRVKILISTAFGMVDPAEVVSWMLKDKLRARFQLQLHKYVWAPEERRR
jgi:7-carboxy-7-deazaguanine synthase